MYLLYFLLKQLQFSDSKNRQTVQLKLKEQMAKTGIELRKSFTNKEGKHPLDVKNQQR